MKKIGVRDRVINAASQLFYFNGYNQTGINQIVEEASVAKASMYQHFRSKEDIAVAYLQRRHIEWVDNLFAFVANERTYRERLIGCFDFLEDWLIKVDFRGCGFQNIITDLPNDQQKIKDQVLLHKNELRNWVQDQLKENKQFSEQEAEQLGDEIIVLLEGAIILSQIQKDTWPIKSAKTTCRKLLPKQV